MHNNNRNDDRWIEIRPHRNRQDHDVRHSGPQREHRVTHPRPEPRRENTETRPRMQDRETRATDDKLDRLIRVVDEMNTRISRIEAVDQATGPPRRLHNPEGAWGPANEPPRRTHNPEGSGPPRKEPTSNANRLRRQEPASLPPRSSNPDFTGIVRALYKLVQIQHHASNWEDIPYAIQRDLNYFIDSITPPDPTENIRELLAGVFVCAGHEAQSFVQQHLTERLGLHRNFLEQANPLDKDRAIDIALKQLKKSLGKKITGNSLMSTLVKEARTIGLNHGRQTTTEVAPRPSPPVEQPPTKRRNIQGTPPSTNFLRIPLDQPTVNHTPEEHPDITEMDGTTDVAEGHNYNNPITNPITNPRTNPNPQEDRPQTSEEHDSVGRKNKRRRKTVHGAQTKHFWRVALRPETATLVISDSNLALVEEDDIPDDWQLEIFSGAQFANAAKLIKDLPIDRPAEIITSVGVNHRKWDFGKSTYRETQRIREATRERQGNLHALGVAFNKTLPASEQTNLQRTNDRLKQIYGNNFIDPLQPDAVHTEEDGIHHTQATTKRVWHTLLAHMNIQPKN